MVLDPPANISVHNVTTYRIVHRGLSERDRSELSKGGIVLLHSGAAARHFALECERAGLARAHLSLAALAPRIAASAGDGWKSVAVAASPDDAALLSLAADMCH